MNEVFREKEARMFLGRGGLNFVEVWIKVTQWIMLGGFQKVFG